MPVAPVETAASPTPLEAPAPPAAGFEELLSAKLPAAGSLPSVPLGQMVASLAQGPTLPSSPAPDQAVAQGIGALAGTRAPGGAAPSAVDGAAGPGTASAGPGAAVLEAGERYLGVPYKWGGTSAATGFDCSGFTQQAFADIGIQLPRVSVDQARTGSPVGSLAEARPGDLVFWGASGGRPNHIGIYAGDGEMLVAPRTGDVVRYQDITRTPDSIRRVIT